MSESGTQRAGKVDTDLKVEAVLLVQNGMTPEQVAAQLGVAPRRLAQWLERADRLQRRAGLPDGGEQAQSQTIDDEPQTADDSPPQHMPVQPCVRTQSRPQGPLLSSSQLPRLTFIDATGTAQVLEPAMVAAHVAAVAAHLQQRLAAGSRVGLIFRCGPELVCNWLACLAAGLQPLILPYPTRKQSAAYWEESIAKAVDIAALQLLLVDAPVAARDVARLAPVLMQSELDALPATADGGFVIDDFSILQMSSGTTGHRKAIAFSGAQVWAHVTDLNEVLRLTPGSDCIVSWLPLYHDMGFVACFVMPLLLKIELVLIDPVDWVAQPQLLFDAIQRHQGTVCYMPNFGFEVMQRCAAPPMATMRWWISCSEPVSADTSRRFMAHIGAPAERFAACYAMAENVFAVSLSRGLSTQWIDGVEVVSCGAPIPGVAVKRVAGEFWVNSVSSLSNYLDGAPVCDAEGFYATGDLGSIIDGALHVTGRRQDLLIQAGRKFMLSDIDLALNRIDPTVRGRAVAVQVADAQLGTQKALVLIEADDFFRRHDQGAIEQSLRDAVGIEQVQVAFVPPRFLTKTSSGKFNRKLCAKHWLQVQAGRTAAGDAPDPLAELRQNFGTQDWDQPVGELLDSLSLTVLQIILADAGQTYDRQASLNQIAAGLQVRPIAASEQNDTIRIVSLADRRIFARMNERHLNKLTAALGVPVTFEHICLPPAAIVLSDLIFSDYFLPRISDEHFATVLRIQERLRRATVILADDIAELFFPPFQVYGALSHRMERSGQADLVAVRWQRYPQMHHLLPVTVVSGIDLPLKHRTQTLNLLGEYLQRPIYRIATIQSMAAFTEGWEYRPLGGQSGAPGSLEVLNMDAFVTHLAGWLKDRPETLKLGPKPPGPALEMHELAHYCSRIVNAASVDRILAHYDRFCIVGQEASAPYVARQLDRLGKHYVRAPSYAPEILDKLAQDVDCLVICGPQGKYRIDLPAIALMVAQSQWLASTNIDDPVLADLQFIVGQRRVPPTGNDWFHPFEMDRDANEQEISEVREIGARMKAELRARQNAEDDDPSDLFDE